MSDDFELTQFQEALAIQEIRIPLAKQRRLHAYCLKLWEWNEKINLTRHTTYEKFIGRDLVDALRLAELLHPNEHVLDVGTGGGVPGIPLAILRPDLRVELCDSTGKKVVAVAEILAELKLNVPVWNGKAQELLKVHRFTTLIIRAVAKLPKLLDWFAPHWQKFDRMLLVKGPAWVEERGESRHLGKMSKLSLRKLASYPLPGTDQESVILQICQRDKFETLETIITEHAAAPNEIGVANRGSRAGRGQRKAP